MSLNDGRSKQSSRPRKISVEKTNAVIEHISSFKRRKGYYNLAESTKIYLPEELNITKITILYIEKKCLSK